MAETLFLFITSKQYLLEWHLKTRIFQESIWLVSEQINYWKCCKVFLTGFRVNVQVLTWRKVTTVPVNKFPLLMMLLSYFCLFNNAPFLPRRGQASAEPSPWLAVCPPWRAFFEVSLLPTDASTPLSTGNTQVFTYGADFPHPSVPTTVIIIRELRISHHTVTSHFLSEAHITFHPATWVFSLACRGDTQKLSGTQGQIAGAGKALHDTCKNVPFCLGTACSGPWPWVLVLLRPPDSDLVGLPFYFEVLSLPRTSSLDWPWLLIPHFAHKLARCH